jgi:ABC-type transport system involved in multi-copper enzyme maturation permease subunit
MKSLILKDYRAYSLYYKLILVISFLYSYLNIRFGSVDGIIGFLVVLLPALSGVILFIGDEAIYYYLTALPNSRKSIVLSKYISTYLFTSVIILVTIGIIYALSFNYPDAKSDLNELLTLRGFLFALMPITLIVSFCYPLLFKFGLKIGVKIAMGFFAVLYGLGIVVLERVIRMTILIQRGGIFHSIMKYLDYYEETHSTIIYYLVLVLLFVMLMISIFLSVHWYQKKDIA